ncbi:aminopeptidase N [Rhodovulum iodosum]|uniref:Aminopeptidase N n=1 Tax=Rhodovulum iodosum TaxID=68291 RepID=A0ABV3XXU2_9RHOB|nr:M1 family aminopeptidase [Rhodovulum robiginosum]RSK41045.1 hypothetical protein EJA01_00100 [Rhodovulum robiginosum]
MTLRPRLRPVALAVGLLLGLSAAHPGLAQSGGDTPPPVLSVDMTIDTATGDVTIAARMERPAGAVRLPAVDWLSAERVGIEATHAALDAADGIAPSDHAGRTLDMRFTGVLPRPSEPPGRVAWSAEASYLVGGRWLPADGTPVREYEIAVTVDAGQRVAATGSLLSDGVEAGKRRTAFRFTGRGGDLGVFIGAYTVQETAHRDLTLRTYFAERESALSARYLGAVAGYIDRYEAVVGPYPYDSFAVVSAPIPVGLGFAGLTYVSEAILAHPYMQGRSLAHEVLHSWWGNAVGVDYASGNWAEGLTTFQADYALAEEQGGGAARDMRIGWLRDLAALPEGAMQPLTAFRSASHAGDQSQGYGKAALVFHMLRDDIGRDAFGAGIRRLYADNRAGIAGWRDLQAAFEAASGRALGAFFDQWIGRPGLPRVEIGDVALTDRADGPELRLLLRQSQPAYRLRVPVVIETVSGPVAEVVEMTGATAAARFRLSSRPLSVAVDPGFDLARRPLEGELAPILRSIRGAGAITGIAASQVDGVPQAIEDTLGGLLRGHAIDWRERDSDNRDGVTLVAGLTGDVMRRRADLLATESPVSPASGSTRVWVERDAEGRIWAFVSADSLGDLRTDLRALRYYAGESYVVFEGGRKTESGVWPTSTSPMRVVFE